jgi:probable 2-oxoglutarate dehydrogenase E1 component DHKTD1
MALEECKALGETYNKELESHLTDSSNFVPVRSAPNRRWQGIVWPASKDAIHEPETGVSTATLKEIGKASVKYQADFVSYDYRMTFCELIPDRKFTHVYKGT